MRIGVLFGGKSGEHEVSLLSARSVIDAIDATKHQIIPIGVDKEGLWCKSDMSLSLQGGRPFIDACKDLLSDLDVVFPVLHGPFGEDGTIQGMLEIAGIPYVGASVLGSSIGLDKDVTKRLARDAGIKIVDFITAREKPSFEEVEKVLGLPLFVKPATMGSSVGITKVCCYGDFDKAVDLAFSFDRKIVIEKGLTCREIECSVLGLDNPVASLPGEIIPKGGIYSYENKYLDPEGAKFILPANLSPKKSAEVQEMALKIFGILCCEGMARVDFFMDQNETLYFNELNTIPGFTSISLYPKMWEVSGLPYSELIEKIIELALEKSHQKNILSISI